MVTYLWGIFDNHSYRKAEIVKEIHQGIIFIFQNIYNVHTKSHERIPTNDIFCSFLYFYPKMIPTWVSFRNGSFQRFAEEAKICQQPFTRRDIFRLCSFGKRILEWKSWKDNALGVGQIRHVIASSKSRLNNFKIIHCGTGSKKEIATSSE